MLREMSDRQSDVRELLMDIRTTQDKTQEMGLAGNLGYPDDLIIAVVMADRELMEREEEVNINDLILAGAFLDNLDTQGFRVKAKKVKRKKGKKHGVFGQSSPPAH